MKKLLLLLGLCTGLVGCGSLYESPLDNLQKIKKDLLNIKGRATNYQTLDRFKYYSLNEIKPTSMYVNKYTGSSMEVSNQIYKELENMIKNEYGRDGVKLLELFNKLSYDALLKRFPEDHKKLMIAVQTKTDGFYGAMNLAESCEYYRKNGYSSIYEYKEYGRRKADILEKEIEKRKAECNVFKDSSHPFYDSTLYIDILKKFLEKYYQ